MVYKKIIISAVMTIICAAAANAGTPYNVDDPGTTEAKATQVAVQYLTSQLRGVETQSSPLITITYGINNNTEADLLTGVASARLSGSNRSTGWADTQLGLRWRFQEETAVRPQIGLAYFGKLPTASARLGLGSGVADHQIYSMAAKSFGRNSIIADAGYSWVGSRQGHCNWLCGCAVLRQVNDSLNIGAQLYGNTPSAPGAASELAWGVGGIYNYAPNRALLVQVGRSMRGFSDCNLSIGWQYTFAPPCRDTPACATSAPAVLPPAEAVQ